jgi:hypothetical protein
LHNVTFHKPEVAGNGKTIEAFFKATPALLTHKLNRQLLLYRSFPE